MTHAALEAWLVATNPTDRAAETRAFLSAFDRENSTVLADAVREYLGNPDRKGRPGFADLRRTLARLKGAEATRDTGASDNRLVFSDVPRMLGFRRDPEAITRGATTQQVANWLREYGDLILDRCLWAHERPTSDPLVARMQSRREIVEDALASAGWVRVCDAAQEWRDMRDARRKKAAPAANNVDPVEVSERLAIAAEGLS